VSKVQSLPSFEVSKVSTLQIHVYVPKFYMTNVPESMLTRKLLNLDLDLDLQTALFSRLRLVKGALDRCRRFIRIVVVVDNDDDVLADVIAIEAEILDVELALFIKGELITKFGDLLVEARLLAIGAEEVLLEGIESSCELLDDDNLDLYFADFFQNQLFDKLLEDEQLLLNVANVV